MVKNLYIVGILFISLLSFLTGRKISKTRENKIAKTITTMFTLISGCLIIHVLAIVDNKTQNKDLYYLLFVIVVDLLLVTLLQFALHYTDCWEKGEKYLRVTWGGAALDIILMLTSLRYGGLVHFERLNDQARSTYYVIESYGKIYLLHLVFCYCLILCFFVILIRKIVITSPIYRKKYLLMCLGVAVIVILDMVSLRGNVPIDVSMMFYVLMCYVAYYFSFCYVPKPMLDSVFHSAVNVSNFGILFFDNDGKCIFINQRASEISEMIKRITVETEKYSDTEQFFKEWILKNQIGIDEKKIYQRKCEDHGQVYYIEFVIQKLKSIKRRSKKEECLGYIVTADDRTREMQWFATLQHKTTIDRLTGIYLGSNLKKKVTELLQSSIQNEFIFLITDIKDFKIVNSMFGEKRGDEILVAVADMLAEYGSCGAIYGRLSDDRFGLFLSKEKFHEKEFLQKIYSLENTYSEKSYRLYIKVGVYHVKDKAEPVFSMIDKCMIAITTIKDKYDITMAYYDDFLLGQEEKKRKIVSNFDAGISQKEFVIYLQAQCTSDGKMVGAEALCRWNHQSRLMTPYEFMPILEESGLIYRMDLYVWELAVRQLRKWLDEGIENTHISINISAYDMQRLDIYQEIKTLVQKYNVPPNLLILEITESMFIVDVGECIQMIDRLKQYGFQIAIDDFGSGYSSLNILKDIMADELKLDMKFLQETAHKQRGEDIITLVVELAKKLHMKIIVEGVETSEQLHLLQQLGCDLYQGYYFSRPVSIFEFEKRYLFSNTEDEQNMR